ncbi:hypothetical protein ACE40V_23750, partial [Salmonella enterica]|uniref:hypothetical protein n=1 Tax=Salmonella enterica TaxID=28901 RepID=UPI003D26CB63
DYNAVTDRMFSLRNIPSQIDPDAAANAAAGATDDVAANAAKTLIHDPTAAGVGATDLAEQTSMQMAKSMGKNMLEKGWKGLVKPGGASIIGAGVS